MKRTQIYLEEEQDEKLAQRASLIGMSKSELIRQAINEYLNGPSDDAVRLTRLKQMAKELAKRPAKTFGGFPDGKSYVEHYRAIDRRRDEEIERRRR
ncbi:MAG: ribbon-helix-helix domain-containing protein [Actinomycetota bacterium]